MQPVTDPELLAILNGGGGPVYGAPAKPDKPTQPKTTYRTLSEAEARDRGLPPGKVYQISSEGNVTAIGGAEAGGTSAEVAGKAGALDSVIKQINRVQELYDAGIRDESFSNAFGLLDGIGPDAAQFDSAGAALGDQGMAAFKVPGMGPQSDQDAARFVAANQPQAGDWDARIEEKLRSLRSRVDANRAAMGLPPAEWLGQQKAGDYAPKVLSQAPTQYAAAEDVRTSIDPEMSARIDRLIKAGAPLQAINAMLGQRGFDPIAPEAYDEWRTFLSQNPGFDGSSAEAIRNEPLSAYEQTITDIGSGAAGAYALGAGQFLSGNTLDNLASDPEQARLAMDVSRAGSPTAYGVGELTGGVLAAFTGEAGLARLGMASGLGRGVAADAAMNGANAAGSADNGGRTQNALLGALTGGAASLGGAGAMRLASNALSPTGGPLNRLYEAGVRPTPGQRFGDSGLIGRAVNATEEAMQSVPIVGAAVSGARQEARDQFQIGAFNQALAEVGEQLPKGMKVGTAPHAYSQKVFDRVYDEARSGMRVVADEELTNEVGSLFEQVRTLAEPSQRRFEAITRNVVMRRLQGGNLEGDAYKKAYSDLGKQIRSIRNSPSGDGELADALQGLQDTLDGAARRHSDPEAVELLDAADAGYAKFVRIEEAAQRRGGDAGTFTPTQFDSSVQKTSGGTRSKAYLRGDALMQDYAEQGKALVDRLPNSGTVDRGLQVGGMGAAAGAYFEPSVAATLGAVGAAYAPGVRQAVKGAFAPPGPTRKAIAQRLKKRAQLVGRLAGAASAVSLPEATPAQ